MKIITGTCKKSAKDVGLSLAELREFVELAERDGAAGDTPVRAATGDLAQIIKLQVVSA